MKYLQRCIAVILIAAILSLSQFSFTLPVVNAGPSVIHKTSIKENITSGVTHENIKKFTVDGWLNINVLRVNLSNKYIKVDTLSNSDSLLSLATTKSLAQSRGAVAAVNGGFFSWADGTGQAYPLASSVESGKPTALASTRNTPNETLATFAMTDLNEVLYNYWKIEMTLIAPNGKTFNVARYNKPSSTYGDMTVIDRKWGKLSIGRNTKYPDITEMVVVDGKVSEVRKDQPAVKIPESGYVVIARNSGGKFLRENFSPGEAVVLDIKTTPDWGNITMAVTGGSILLKDGKIPSTFSKNTPDISGRHPRTAIGSSKDGKQLILVTVDGRQNASIGMTQTELAEQLLELGAHNALNMDGGGSTTMVARDPWGRNLGVVNRPSDGSERRVANAIGIFSIAPPADLDGFIIEASHGDENIFVNTSRKFYVKGYDRYLNPKSLNEKDVKWSVKGLKGSFKGNVFYPKSVGEGKIIGKVGDITSEYDINVLSSPLQLTLSSKSVQLEPGKSKTLSVVGMNKDGYEAHIDAADVKWTVSGLKGQIEKGKFTADSGGVGYIDAAVGSVHAYCTVSVAKESNIVKDTFEESNGSFTAYPATVSGGYQISDEQKHEGNFSGKLSYEFPQQEKTRAAYFVLKNGGIPLEKNTAKIGLWVYNDHPNPNWLRAEFIDSAGKTVLVDFTQNINWTGWKYIEASTKSVSMPAKLTRIYTVQISPIADSGSLYLDDLTVMTSVYPAVNASKTPKDTAFKDEDNKSVTYVKSSNSHRFAVFGQSHEPKTGVEKTLVKKLTDKVNNYLESAAFVGQSTHEIRKDIKKPYASTNTGHKAYDIKSSRFIQLDMSSGGLRRSSSTQWKWLFTTLNNTKASNVFIFLAKSPGSFSDSLEGTLLKDVLTEYGKKTGKRVWVFYKGSSNSSTMERGIKYISTAGYDVSGLSSKNMSAGKYVLVTVKGNSVTYEFKSVG